MNHIIISLLLVLLVAMSNSSQTNNLNIDGEVKETSISYPRFELSIKYLPDSLASPFNHPTVHNNPLDPWVDSEFQKHKNELWEDTSLLFPLSDFDKILCFQYKKLETIRMNSLLNKEGYISDDVITPGKELTDEQSNQLLAIINDTSAYDRSLYNGVFSWVKIYGLLIIKDENKVVGQIDIYEDHVEMAPVIPRAGYGSLRMKNEFLDKIKRLAD